MNKQAITITIELSSVDPIRKDLTEALENYLTLQEEGRNPIEAEVIAMMLEKAIKTASRLLINNDMYKLHGSEMINISPIGQMSKWYIESEKIPLPEIWINPWSIISVDWADKT
jgi:hypothetical protein